MAFQSVKTITPEFSVWLQPLINLSQRLRTQFIPAPLCILTYTNQPHLAQHA
jgi:hypothetical protein